MSTLQQPVPHIGGLIANIQAIGQRRLTNATTIEFAITATLPAAATQNINIEVIVSNYLGAGTDQTFTVTINQGQTSGSVSQITENVANEDEFIMGISVPSPPAGIITEIDPETITVPEIIDVTIVPTATRNATNNLHIDFGATVTLEKALTEEVVISSIFGNINGAGGGSTLNVVIPAGQTVVTRSSTFQASEVPGTTYDITVATFSNIRNLRVTYNPDTITIPALVQPATISAEVTVVRDSADQVTYTMIATADAPVGENIAVTFGFQNANGQGGGGQFIVNIAEGETVGQTVIPLTSVISGAFTTLITATVDSPHTVNLVSSSLNVPAAIIPLTVEITAERDPETEDGINISVTTTAPQAVTENVGVLIDINNRLGGGEEFQASVGLISGDTTRTSTFNTRGTSPLAYTITPALISIDDGYSVTISPTSIDIPALPIPVGVSVVATRNAANQVQYNLTATLEEAATEQVFAGINIQNFDGNGNAVNLTFTFEAGDTEATRQAIFTVIGDAATNNESFDATIVESPTNPAPTGYGLNIATPTVNVPVF